MDFSILKDTMIAEQVKFQIRTEAFHAGHPVGARLVW